jgi:hypothetical protein
LERLITETILETASVGPKSDFFVDDKDDCLSQCTSTESILQDLDSMADSLSSEAGSTMEDSPKNSPRSVQQNLLPPIPANDSDSELSWSPEALAKSLMRKVGSFSYQSSSFEEFLGTKQMDSHSNYMKNPSTPDNVIPHAMSQGTTMSNNRETKPPMKPAFIKPSLHPFDLPETTSNPSSALFSVSHDNEGLIVKPNRFDPPGKVLSLDGRMRGNLGRELWSLSADDNIEDGWTTFNTGNNPFSSDFDTTSIESPSSIADFPTFTQQMKFPVQKQKRASRRNTAEI